MKRLLFQFLSTYEKRRNIKPIYEKEILWNNKPIKEKSVLLWDLENIPFHRLDDIKRIVKYTPDELYIITKQTLGQKLLTKIHKESFKVLTDHKSISDTKIIAMMKLFQDRENMILISSDSDFAKEVNRYLKKHKLQWIVVENVKKAVVMRVNLASKNLTLNTIRYKKSQRLHRSNNMQKIHTLKKPNNYNIVVYYQYYISRFREWLQKIKSSLSLPFKQKNSINNDPTFEDSSIIQKEKIKNIYRRNYKGRRTVCGRLYFYDSKMKLTLHKKLLYKYNIPNFKNKVEFKNFSEVKELIHFDEDKKEYYLNKFERLEDTFS